MYEEGEAPVPVYLTFVLIRIGTVYKCLYRYLLYDAVNFPN